MKNKRTIVLLLAAIVVLLALNLMTNSVTPQATAGEPPPEIFPEIRARRLVIVNDEGEPRILMAATKDGAVISILDCTAESLVTLYGANGFGSIKTTKDGESLVQIGMRPRSSGTSGIGRIIIYGPSEKVVAEMSGTKKGGYLSLGNKDDKTVAGLTVSEDGGGMVYVTSRDGKKSDALIPLD